MAATRSRGYLRELKHAETESFGAPANRLPENSDSGGDALHAANSG